MSINAGIKFLKKAIYKNPSFILARTYQTTFKFLTNKKTIYEQD